MNSLPRSYTMIDKELGEHKEIKVSTLLLKRIHNYFERYCEEFRLSFSAEEQKEIEETLLWIRSKLPAKKKK